jgi:hypothetical protein
MTCTIDHYVVAAASLGAGTQYVEQALGFPLTPGGQHPKMGTHNALLRLGEGAYLEVIAIDPSLPNPPRPRWFGLDRPSLRASLETPRLVSWAVRTADVNALTAASPVGLGTVHAMSRSTLNWLLTIPDDGNPVMDGACPFAIEWLGSVHPVHKLPHRHLSVERFTIETPERAKLAKVLDAIRFDKQGTPVEVTDAPQTKLTLTLKTKAGLITVSDGMTAAAQV